MPFVYEYIMSAKLIISNAYKSFQVNKRLLYALEDLTLSIASNEFVSIVGPSGCGKTTLLNLVAGLESLTSGDILVDGKLILEPGADRGMVFQSYTLFPWLTVLDNIGFALRKSRLPHAEKYARVKRKIEQVGLVGFENAYPNQLSGGMRQRVTIARAMVNRPNMLLMDEPFGALDAQTRLLMQELLLDVWQQELVTVLFVTHDVEEALLLSDRIYVMTPRPGRIKSEVVVNLSRPRKLLDTSENPNFIKLRNQIIRMIRESSQ